MKTRIGSFILILMLSVPLAIAQSADKARVSFSILGGVNFQNLNGKDTDGDKLENDLTLGYHAGINIQIPFAPQIFFQPGLLLTTKGAKNSNNSITVKTKLTYLELPLNVVYKALLGEGAIMIGFGPYIGYGIGGKLKGDNDETDIVFENTVKVSDPDDVAYFKALDAGANIFAGYELANGFFFQLNTQLGLIKINPKNENFTEDKSTLKNTGFGLSLGYRF